MWPPIGILAGIIAAMRFTVISNISAQGMTTTITTSSNDTWQMQGKANLTGTIEIDKAIAESLLF